MVKIAKNLRVYVTENCNARCKNCFNSSCRTNAEMDVEKFSDISKFLKLNDVEHIKIMGGEPTVHPDFSEIIRIAQENFKEVSIFTNAINDGILKISPRETDSIIYNFKFSKVLTEEKIVLNNQGKRALEVQVQKDSDIARIESELIRIFKISTSVRVSLTLDCTADIFDERTIVIKKYEDLQNFCKIHNIQQDQDHILPLCYVRGTSIPLPKNGAICSLFCAGLIDANYNLRFCNQHSDIITSIFDEKGSILSWRTLTEHLEEKHNELKKRLQAGKCHKCPFWLHYCNGGCFMK